MEGWYKWKTKKKKKKKKGRRETHKLTTDYPFIIIIIRRLKNSCKSEKMGGEGRGGARTTDTERVNERGTKYCLLVVCWDEDRGYGGDGEDWGERQGEKLQNARKQKPNQQNKP
jgi:hypothetical protein